MCFLDAGSNLMERGIAMCEMPFALLVDDGSPWSAGLKSILVSRGFAVYSAGSCGEAALLLDSPDPPHMVFTSSRLPDGTWADVLAAIRKCGFPVNAVVVSPHVDVSLYIEVLEQGGFDFVVPPFQWEEIDHVIRNAMASVDFRRGLANAKRRSISQASAEASEGGELHLRDDGFHVTPLA